MSTLITQFLEQIDLVYTATHHIKKKIERQTQLEGMQDKFHFQLFTQLREWPLDPYTIKEFLQTTKFVEGNSQARGYFFSTECSAAEKADVIILKSTIYTYIPGFLEKHKRLDVLYEAILNGRYGYRETWDEMIEWGLSFLNEKHLTTFVKEKISYEIDLLRLNNIQQRALLEEEQLNLLFREAVKMVATIRRAAEAYETEHCSQKKVRFADEEGYSLTIAG